MIVQDTNLDIRFAVSRAQIALKRNDVDTAWTEMMFCLDRVDRRDQHRNDLVHRLYRMVGTERLRALIDQGRYLEAVEMAAKLIDWTGGECGDETYQLLNDALTAVGFDTAEDYHGLTHISGSLDPVESGDLVCCLVVKNGMWRIADYLDGLRGQGITRFFAFDNDSGDDTGRFLAAQDDVTSWHTTNSFSSSNSGAAWFDVILRRYAPRAWTLILDLDEDIRVPGDLPLLAFCRALEDGGFKAATGFLVDLYPRSSTDSTPCFDRDLVFPHQPSQLAPHQRAHALGLRRRVFGDNVIGNKAPLQRFEPGLCLGLGQHFSHHDVGSIAHRTCAVLHHKFAAGFVDRVAPIGHDDRYHASWRNQNATYARLGNEADGAMYDPRVSVPLTSTFDLVAYDLLRTIDDPRVASDD